MALSIGTEFCPSVGSVVCVLERTSYANDSMTTQAFNHMPCIVIIATLSPSTPLTAQSIPSYAAPTTCNVSCVSECLEKYNLLSI